MIKLGEVVMILDLHRQGLLVSAIARRLGIDRKTVRKYIASGLQAPAYGPRQPRPCLIDPFIPYLRERVAAYPGLTERRLWRELKEHGYQGGYTAVTDALLAPTLAQGRSRMTLVRIHHDGWLALPPIQRRRLGLKTGDMLEVVPAEDSLLLRRKATAGKMAESAPSEPEAVVPAADAAGQAPAAETTAKEPRGGRRPRAAATAGGMPAPLPFSRPAANAISAWHHQGRGWCGNRRHGLP